MALRDTPHGVRQESYPDEELCQNLKALQEQTGTTVVLTTGRNIKTIHSWFGATGIDLVAEFGACIMRNGELTNTQGVDPVRTCQCPRICVVRGSVCV